MKDRRSDVTRRSALLSGLSLVSLAALGCDKTGGEKQEDGPAKPTIAVIPKGTTHEFWKSVHAGAEKARRELDVEILWKGPLKEDDLKGQIEVVESMVARGVKGIVLAPLSDKGLVNAVRSAKAAGIPVVVFDSGLEGDHHESFVATDNHAAGAMGGAHLAKLLGDKGKVVLMRYQEGSASTDEREKGFLEAIRKSSGIEIVSDNQYGGATTESAFATGENILAAHKASEGGVDGVFCPNESTTFGMLLALQKASLTGKVKLVGFDSSEKLVQGLKDDAIHGLVLQNPLNIGYLAVKTMVSHLRGEAIEKRIDTGATLVEKSNMSEPAIAELLRPDLAKWLGP